MKLVLFGTTLLLGTSCCVAFSPRSDSSWRKAKLPSVLLRKPKTQLAFSDIPENDPDEQKKASKKSSAQQQQQQQQQQQKRPNQLVLWGDMLSIFVYGYTDHFVGQDLAKYTVSQMMTEMTQQSTAAAAVDAASAAAEAGIPVWLDTSLSSSSSSTSSVLAYHSAQLTDKIVVKYSPLLEQTGVATCLLAGTWLLAGWVLQSFSYRNTTDCSTEHALWQSVRTWIMSSLILLTLSAIFSSSTSSVLLSSSSTTTAQDFMSCFSWPKGDVAFIMDSLSVLLLWRFLASWLLGTGGSQK